MRLMKFSPLAILAFAPLSANALLITPSTAVCGTATCLFATGNETTNAGINTILEGLGIPSEIYKADGSGTGTGTFAGSYLTTYAPDDSDPSGATIVYQAGEPVADADYLLVKDGNQTPAWYLFLLDWDGTETITLADFWPNQGAISHIALYGGEGDCCTEVPEPGTLSLLGSAMLGLAILRRRRRFWA